MTEAFPNDTPQQRAFRAFETLVAGEDMAIDLSLAALLIANLEYPELDIAHYMAQLDSLAERVRALLGLTGAGTLEKLPVNMDVSAVIAAMNTVLFGQEHFHGNTQDYYNSSNSFLNEVLERHTGIPIALSLLYMEVGRRVGVWFDGIGLPFHFVVGCRFQQKRIYIDPFESGRVLSEQECRRRVRQVIGKKDKIPTQWFEPVSRKYLLIRMLNNLKHIYLHSEDYARALRICDCILVLAPRSPQERRDRGVIYLQLKRYGRALSDLAAYLQLAPLAEDHDEIQRQVKMIRQILAMMN
ncbi:MAG: tetratricopeptide repeat protein [Chloroflexi bacterium]|nr:MAG: tetratricopeptide repeat protein [Chloroflexota bacterium]